METMASETKVRLIAPAEAPASEGFTARLMGVTLADLIQMKCMSGATESIRILSAGRMGMLQFLKGHLTHAATSGRLGDDAVLELLQWRTGDCESFAGSLPHGSLVRRAWQSLLLGAAQESDERARLRAGPGVRESLSDARSETPTPGRTRAVSVRMSRDGQVLHSVGAAEELASASAYASLMATYIGESLGLDAFRGCEFRAGELRTLLVVEETSGELLAVQSEAEADVAEARARLRL
jgi:hypothetical protein